MNLDLGKVKRSFRTYKTENVSKYIEQINEEKEIIVLWFK